MTNEPIEADNCYCECHSITSSRPSCEHCRTPTETDELENAVEEMLLHADPEFGYSPTLHVRTRDAVMKFIAAHDRIRTTGLLAEVVACAPEKQYSDENEGRIFIQAERKGFNKAIDTYTANITKRLEGN